MNLRRGLNVDFILGVVFVPFGADSAAEALLLFSFVCATRDIYGDVDRDFRVQNNANLLKADKFESAIQNNLTLVDGHAFGGRGFCDVARGNRTVELTAVASGPDYGNHQTLKLLGNLFGFGLALEIFRFELGAAAFKMGEVDLVGPQGFPCGSKNYGQSPV